MAPIPTLGRGQQIRQKSKRLKYEKWQRKKSFAKESEQPGKKGVQCVCPALDICPEKTREDSRLVLLAGLLVLQKQCMMTKAKL